MQNCKIAKRVKKTVFSWIDVNNFLRACKIIYVCTIPLKISFIDQFGCFWWLHSLMEAYVQKMKNQKICILAFFACFGSFSWNNRKNAKMQIFDFSFFGYIVSWDYVVMGNRQTGRWTIFWAGSRAHMSFCARAKNY